MNKHTVAGINPTDKTRPTITNVDFVSANTTTTVDQLLLGLWTVPAATAITFTLPPASEITQSVSAVGASVADAFPLLVRNTGADTLTIAVGAGGASSGTLTIPPTSYRQFEVRLDRVTPGTETYTLFDMGALGTSGAPLGQCPVEVGLNASASGNADSIALGCFAAASGADAIALGSDTTNVAPTVASGLRSVAIGTGASTSAGDTGSVALGADAQTNLANQLVIGDTAANFLDDIRIGPSVKMTFAPTTTFVVSGIAGSLFTIGPLPALECIALKVNVALCAANAADSVVSFVDAAIVVRKPAAAVAVVASTQTETTTAPAPPNISQTLTFLIAGGVGANTITVQTTPTYGGGYVPTGAVTRVSLENVSPGNAAPLLVTPV